MYLLDFLFHFLFKKKKKKKGKAIFVTEQNFIASAFNVIIFLPSKTLRSVTAGPVEMLSLRKRQAVS